MNEREYPRQVWDALMRTLPEDQRREWEKRYFAAETRQLENAAEARRWDEHARGTTTYGQ